MSSRSNSSSQSKGTHLPLQKRVFNAPLAAVIAMGCVTGIAGGIAATSAHPMQAAYAASSTTQGVFTLDRAAAGMDRSANEIVKAPCFFIDNDNQFHDYDNFEWGNINKGSYIKDLKDRYLAPYYGLTDTMDISYNQGSGVFTIHKNGVEYTQTLAEMFGNYVKLTRLEDVGKKVIGPSVDDPNVQNKIKTAFIEANKDLRIIDPSELYFTTYCYYNEDTGQTEKDRVFAYVSKSGRTIDSRTSVPQIVHDYYICGIKRVFEAGDSEPAPLSLATTELADEQKVEVADPAKPEDFTPDQLSAIKDALNNANPKVGDKDAVSAVKYETNKLIALLSDGTTKVDLDAAKLTKKKVVVELQTLTVTAPAVTEVVNTAQIQDDEVTKIKTAIKAANQSLNLQDSEITVETTTGKVTIKRQGYKDVTLEASKVVKQKPAELQTLNVTAPAVTEVVNTAQIQDDEVTKIKTAIKAANQSLNLQDSEITVDTATGKVTITRAGFKPVVLEANKVVTKKVVTPIEPPAPEPPTKESLREILKRTNPAMFVAQSRIAGKTALDTMEKIVQQAFPSAENVVLATQYGYWDALSANALAGSLNAPIMLSDFDSLPEQTVAQLKRLQAKTVYICGGTHVISKQVEQQLHQLGMRVVRYAGSEASDTATKIALNTETVSDTCFITTSWGYGDSMSVSSYSYAKHAPIFLTNMNGDIDDSTLDAIRAKGFKHIVLVGGTSVISAEVEDLVRSLGVSVERVWGETQYDTSLAFAKWATQDSKEPLTIGISTGYGFTDALCGAALTGKAGGVMVLADDSMTKQAFSAFKDFVGTHAKQIEDLQIFGGTSVVGMGVTQALTSEFKEAYQNDNASAAPEGTSTPTQPQGTAGQTQPPLRREN